MHAARLSTRPLLLAALGLSLLVPNHAWAQGAGTTSTGDGALPATTTGSDNTADGSGALGSDTSGNHNTATGFGALQSNTSGHENNADGCYALHANTTGYYNAAVGHFALAHNTRGFGSTALGFEALMLAEAYYNTALGTFALSGDTTGYANTAVGLGALETDTTGYDNTAVGAASLCFDTTGSGNTALGRISLLNNATGGSNTGVGYLAMHENTAGSDNTACGANALYSGTGSGNTALGSGAGQAITSGSNNIDIGSAGASGDSALIRIGTPNTQTATYLAGVSGVAVSGAAVVVNSDGQLGVAGSSQRFKRDVRDMQAGSSALYALRPVSFRYRDEIDPQGAPQRGLIAEEVEKVDPSLVIHDKEGKPFTVRYEQVNAMLLNEFLKEHATVQAQAAQLGTLQSALARQQAAIDALNARLPSPTP